MPPMVDDELRDRAVALRREGRSRREICAEPGVGHTRLDRWLEGVPAPPWTRRPRAKDELRGQARELRQRGRSVPGIAAELGVVKSTGCLVVDVPRSTELYRRIAGWWSAVSAAAAGPGSDPGSTVEERSRIV